MVHTQAQPAHTLSRVVGMAWSCRRPGPVVSQRIGGRIVIMSRAQDAHIASPLLVTIQNLYRNLGLCREPCRRALGAVSQPWRTVSRHQVCPSFHDTIDCIVTHLSGQAAFLSRYKLLYLDISLPARPRARAVVRHYARPAVSWSSYGYVVGVAWPYRGPLAAPKTVVS